MSYSRSIPRRIQCPSNTILLLAVTLIGGSFVNAAEYQAVNLITDDNASHPAALVDPNLVNPWGVSSSATSPMWVSANGSGLSTVYQISPTTDAATKSALEVTIPGAGNVTGQTFNSGAASGAFNGDSFLFGNQDGTISGWRGALGTSAEVLATGLPGNVYTGTTFGQMSGHGYLYSANFHSGNIDVTKGDAGAPDLASNFVDPNLPAGYAPYNVRNLGGTLYVTYALQNAIGSDAVAGAGNGIVDAFDLNGGLLGRIGSQGTLNSPWGLEIAPNSFGTLAGSLLVGNSGDGTISAFDLNTFTSLGQLAGTGGTPLMVDGLRSLIVGNDGNGGSSDHLYFTAGPEDGTHGLFGVLRESGSTTSVPDTTATLELMGVAMIGLTLASRRLPN